MDRLKIKQLLDKKVEVYNNRNFIPDDPISIPHQFASLKDIEIIGFWTAVLSWGLRKTIINKSRELCSYMEHAPYDFIMNHTEADLQKICKFKHRTFNDADTLCFISFFKWFYTYHDSLEEAFIGPGDKSFSIKEGIENLYQMFISAPDFLDRTKKHIATPAKNSSCKRINMFLRWMVRKDDKGVDFGLWTKISAHQLMIPLDVHVFRVGKALGMIQRPKPDWKAVEELTEQLRAFDPEDPVKYDYALFSMGMEGWVTI